MNAEEYGTSNVEGDGIYELLNFYGMLWKKNKELKSCEVRIPDTVIYKRDFPVDFFFFDKKNRDIVRRTSTDIDSNKILHIMKKKSSTDCDISCFYMSTYRNATTIEYFTNDELEDFLLKRPIKGDGILQSFIRSKKEVNDVVRIIWTPTFVKVNRRENINRLDNMSTSLSEKAVTFAGNPVHSKEVLVTQVIEKRLRRRCLSIVKHFREVEKVEIVRMVIFFKVDQKLDLWLLWPSSIRTSRETKSESSSTSKWKRSKTKLPPLNLQQQYVTVDRPNFRIGHDDDRLFCKCCGKMTTDRLVFPSSFAYEMIKKQEKTKKLKPKKKKKIRSVYIPKRRKRKHRRSVVDGELLSPDVMHSPMTYNYDPKNNFESLQQTREDEEKKDDSMLERKECMTPPTQQQRRGSLLSPATKRFINRLRSNPKKVERMKGVLFLMYDVLNDVLYFLKDHFVNHKHKCPFEFDAPIFEEIAGMSGEIECMIKNKILEKMGLMGVEYDEERKKFRVNDLVTAQKVRRKFDELKIEATRDFGVHEIDEWGEGKIKKYDQEEKIIQKQLIKQKEAFCGKKESWFDNNNNDRRKGGGGEDGDGDGDNIMDSTILSIKGGSLLVKSTGSGEEHRNKFEKSLKEDCLGGFSKKSRSSIGSVGRTVNLCFECALELSCTKDHVKIKSRKRYSVVKSRFGEEKKSRIFNKKRASIAGGDFRCRTKVTVYSKRRRTVCGGEKKIYRSRLLNLQPIKKINIKTSSATRKNKKKRKKRLRKKRKIVIEKKKMGIVQKKRKNSILKDFNEIIPEFVV